MEKSHVNNKGRRYDNGKPLGEDLRSLIVQYLTEKGANSESRFIPRGEMAKASERFNVSNNTIKNIWTLYCDSGDVKFRQGARGRPKVLDEEDLNYIAAIKKEKPSETLENIQEKLLQNANKEVTIMTISNALRKDLSGGQWTRKVLTKTATERFTPANEQYTEAYIAEIQSKDPLRLKFMDEAGFALSEAVNRTRGHAPKGMRAIEAQKRMKTTNMTLNLMIGLDGTVFSSFVDGPSNRDEFLKFIDEAATSFSDDGSPVLQPGDVLVVDNATIHRFEAERVLRIFLNNIGVEYIYLPKYSPDMNPVEFSFNYIRTMLKSDRFAPLANDNLQYAILKVLDTISQDAITGFFSKVGYIEI